MFGTIVPHHITRQRKKDTFKRVNQKPLNDGAVSFSADDVIAAIKSANNSKAFGPDKLTVFHLKHLGENAIKYLTHVYNLSVTKCDIPAIWKESIIIPLQKPGKDPSAAASYRPISLLSPVAKILEKLMLPYLNQHLPPQPHQHGFRPKHSTVSALLNISTSVASGFNKRRPPDRTIVVALDLTKAFDSLDHCTLLDKISNTTLPGSITRWLANYLHGRQARTSFRNQVSRKRNIKVGTPQGSIISPTLFNYYISDLPTPPHPIKMVSYADDITVFVSGPHIPPLTRLLNGYLPAITNHLASLSLAISPAKSSVTLLTPHNAELNVHPQVFVQNQLVPLVTKPKILGVTFNPTFTFAEHCTVAAQKVHKRNNILKALTTTSWGLQKETLLTTYNALGKSVINYAAPVWSPNLSDTNYKKLQTAQNSALRIATGCHRMSSIDHLHQEAKMMPVKAHCEMLSAQYLTSCFDATHPCHSLSIPAVRPRKMKHTLTSKSYDKVAQLLANGQADTPAHRKTVKNKLHTQGVKEAIEALQPNKVLQTKPPNINENEKSLPRRVRSTLAQLRSGYSKYLNSYLSRIDPQIHDICPKCKLGPHDTNHLFNCTSSPTQLEVVDLWKKPVEVAIFLELLTDEEMQLLRQ
jgi:hypothetical protein